jgi:hypothetical protein
MVSMSPGPWWLKPLWSLRQAVTSPSTSMALIDAVVMLTFAILTAGRRRLEESVRERRDSAWLPQSHGA